MQIHKIFTFREFLFRLKCNIYNVCFDFTLKIKETSVLLLCCVAQQSFHPLNYAKRIKDGDEKERVAVVPTKNIQSKKDNHFHE